MSPSQARIQSIPGFVSAHSHLAAGVARSDDAGALARLLGRMRAAGYTVVAELVVGGPAQARAAAAAARAAGIRLVCLHALAREGLPHVQPSVAAFLDEAAALRTEGIEVVPAIAALRTVPAAWLEELGERVGEAGDRLHVVAGERPDELAWCRSEHGCRPIELLARVGCLGPHVTVAHATHADGPELDLVAARGAAICACPTGDAARGSGFLAVNRILHRGIPLCVGADVCAVVDPLHELRELEWVARRQKGAPRVLPPDALLELGGARGAVALGLAPGAEGVVEVDLGHPALDGVAAGDLPAAIVESCPVAVLRAVR